MSDTEIVNGTKVAVGESLGGPAGTVCMRTRCQDIIPRILSSTCKKEGKGKHARQVCKPLLAECLDANRGPKSPCAKSCAKYFTRSGEDMLVRCMSECARSNCRVVPAYETCVRTQTIRDVLDCMQNGEGRAIAEACIQNRCHLNTSSAPLQPH